MRTRIKGYRYDNIRVYSPDNVLMFLCQEKRAQWYLKKNLAEQINSKSIRLTFVPNGLGHARDDYHLNDKTTCCCVCGKQDNLTIHHIVPSCYRKHICSKIERYLREFHDVLMLCDECHRTYEKKYAKRLYNEISEKYKVPLAGINFEDNFNDKLRLYKICCALVKHQQKIPKNRTDIMYNRISAICGRRLTWSEIMAIQQNKP